MADPRLWIGVRVSVWRALWPLRAIRLATDYAVRSREILAELLVAAALLVGWAALTIGARALTWGRATAAVWPLSIGLLLCSLCGWRFLAKLAGQGLYALTRDEPRE